MFRLQSNSPKVQPLFLSNTAAIYFIGTYLNKTRIYVRYTLANIWSNSILFFQMPDCAMDSQSSDKSDLVKETSELSGESTRGRKRSIMAGRRIVRKYRRFARQVEYRRLREVVPAVANNERASRVRIGYFWGIVEEFILFILTSKYIVSFVEFCQTIVEKG